MIILVESFGEFEQSLKTGEQTIPLNVEMITDEPTGGEEGKISTYFGMLFQSRDVAHLAHLGTDSFAKHEALKVYYEGVLPLIDSMVEEYQGKNSKIRIDISASNNVDMIPYFEELSGFVAENKSLFEQENIQNKIDEISSLVDSTLYKIKELKQ
jgi:hypothetical protein